MLNLKVYNLDAEICDEIELSEEVFGIEYNEAIIHESVVAYLSNQRQGTKSALTRSEVRGHAKKPWRQKHTGRARHGSTKAPQWVGGGVAFAPKSRDFTKKMNKQAKRYAFFSALSQKINQNEVTIIKDIKLDEPKTKLMQKVLENFKFEGKTILVTKGVDDLALRAGSNIQYLDITTSDILNTYDIVSNKNVVFTVDAIKHIEEACK
ncbi:MAG: 50S ribosomal protein L4 [Clostridia bacterium]|nr:50S ribosomal protein L4 [Clostridia bacterium]